MAIDVARRQFSVRDYYRMAEAGILTEDDRVELIAGEVVETSPIGSRHAACVDRLNALLHRHSGEALIVRIQSPIRLNDYSEPQPDLALLRFRPDYYSEAHPLPADVLLVVEVADTSLTYDRNAKLPLYAEAHIPEVWLVDLANEAVEIYAAPEGGQYQIVYRAHSGDALSSPTLADVAFDVAAILR